MERVYLNIQINDQRREIFVFEVVEIVNNYCNKEKRLGRLIAYKFGNFKIAS